MRLLRQLYIFYYLFTKRFRTHKKAQKAQKRTKNTKKHERAQKSTKTQPKKAQNANERTKIKNVLKKHLRGKK